MVQENIFLGINRNAVFLMSFLTILNTVSLQLCWRPPTGEDRVYRIDLGRQELDWLDFFLEEGYMYEVPWKKYAAFVAAAASETHEFRSYANALRIYPGPYWTYPEVVRYEDPLRLCTP